LFFSVKVHFNIISIGREVWQVIGK
jgi:hypothetical protein